MFQHAQSANATVERSSLASSPAPMTSGASGSSLVFIDTSVPDYQQLVAGVTAGNEVHLLNARANAITQITQVLQGRSGISSLHIVSHGEAGELHFGSGVINSAALASYATQLQSWQNALISGADVLLYGCNVAKGDAGKAFVSLFSELTGADIAASNNLTGNSALGGDWELEVNKGQIETLIPFTSEATKTYTNVLAIKVAIVSDIASGDTTGFAATRDQLNNDTYFDFSATLVSSSDVDTIAELNTYNAVIIGNNGNGEVMNPTFASALRTWVESGGGLVSSGWIVYGDQNNTDIDAVVPVNTSLSYQYTIGATLTPNETVHPVTAGISPFTVVQFAESQSPDAGATLLATSNGQPTVVVANKGLGKSVYLGPIYSGGSGYSLNDLRFGSADRLLEQAVAWAAIPPSDAPAVTLSGSTVAYTENAAATILNTGATVIDTDSLDFNSGNLTINFQTGGTVDDRLAILNQGAGDGQIGVDGSAVTFGGLTIGTFTGGTGTTPLVITFDSATATPTAVQALLSNITYSNVSDNPSTTARTVQFVVSDGDGGTSTAVTRTVDVTAVNDAFTGTVTISGTAIQGETLTASNTLADPDGLGAITYTWFADGSSTGITGSTYNLSQADVGKAFTVQASYTDGGGTAESVLSDATNSVSPPDQPPVLNLPTASAALDDGNSTVISADLTLADADGGTIDGAKVSIGTGFKSGQDALGILGQAGSSGTVEGLGWDYSSSTGILTLTGSASAATYQTALRQVTFNSLSDSPTTAGARDVQFSIGSQLANPDNGHFYEFVTAPGITWTSAKTAAEGLSFFGLQGYLVTATSTAENAFVASKLNGLGWLGASDATVEGEWRWMTGPEAGQQFWSGLSTGGPVGDNFNNWAAGEPNNAGDEDYGHFLSGGQWNDYANATTVDGYVVEYGGLLGDPVLNLVGNVTVTVNSVNDAPTGSVALTGTAQQGSLLTATSTLGDPDGLGALNYQWQQSTDGITWTAISGATASTFTPPQDQVGQFVRSQVSYTDGGGTTETVNSNATASAIANVNDSPTGGVTIDGTITQGQILTANTSTLADLDGLGTLSYQWQQSTDGITWSNIEGATDVTFSPRNGQVGQLLQVAVSYVDVLGTPESLTSAPTSESVEQFNATSDFNGDGSVDIFWRHQNVGQSVFWLMDNVDFAGGDFLSPTVADVNWDIKALGDLNGDGTPDLVWQNKVTNQAAVWLMDGVNLDFGALLPNDAAAGWKVVESGDFNSNGKDDILWRNANTGELAVWFMDGTDLLSGEFITLNAGLDWEVGAVGDFTGDGKTDIFWENRITGANAFWEMDGTTFVNAYQTATAETVWQAKGAADFSQDGNLDLLWHNPGTGENALWLMDGMELTAGVLLPTTEVSWNPTV